ncbi:hypothetical protein quinque_012084 [Culex quinquefasciatus]
MINLRQVALVVALLVFLFHQICASGGDQSQFFQNCLKSCVIGNCSKSGLTFRLAGTQNPINKLLLWTCYDECGYDCMWRTTGAFLKRNWTTPQFYGKWPFVRLAGLQEPASVVFSMTNFGTHYHMLKRFRREVRPDSPMYTRCGSVGRFDYAYNMKANIVTGMTGAAGWIFWCLLQRRKRRYVWKCFLFVVLATSSLLLEINDFPPILWTFDAHSIWHLVTAPLTVLFYSFIIDDCRSLRQELYGDGPEGHAQAAVRIATGRQDGVLVVGFPVEI